MAAGEANSRITEKPDPPLEHIREFDGLRGILALWVVVSHMLCWTGLADEIGERTSIREIREIVDAGPPVLVFIILSGFVISFLVDRQQPTYPAFLTGRFFRLYPVFLAALLIGSQLVDVTALVLDRAHWNNCHYFEILGRISDAERTRFTPHLLAHLTLLFGLTPRAWLPEATATLLPPAWSVTLEWQYYLVAPLLAKLLRRGTGVILLALFYGVCRVFVAPRVSYAPAFLPIQFPLFLIGIVSFDLFKRTARDPALWRPRARLLGLLLVSLALVMPYPGPRVAIAVWALVFAAVTEPGRGTASRLLRPIPAILRHPIARWLGEISYDVYLIHWPILVVILAALLRANPEISGRAALVVLLGAGITMVLVCAQILHVTIERPGMWLGRRIARRNR